MQCVKIGAVCFSEEYGEFLYGDLFVSHNGQYVMRCFQRIMEKLDIEPNLVIKEIDEWFDKDKTSGDQISTILVKSSGDFHYFS